MAQKLIQTQEQKLQQVQRLSAQQMLQVKLLEMPLAELEESVRAELDDNPALEIESPDDDAPLDYDLHEPGDEPEDYESQLEKEERADALDAALEFMGGDDIIQNDTQEHFENAEYENIVYGDTLSFYDKLKEQMHMQELTDRQRDIMEYLIGSLDDDGLLRKDLQEICDELIIYHYMDITVEDVEEVLYILQGFDPAGIGARDLQECLLLQIERKPESRLSDTMRELVTHYYDDFIFNRWDKIQGGLHLTDTQVETLREEMRRLNPKPGASLSETEGGGAQMLTPDFIVDTADDGTITFTINKGNLPPLGVASSFLRIINGMNDSKKSKREREALLYAQQKVDRAKGFIAAVQTRYNTLKTTMQTVIDIQRKFFLDGDEADLRPMTLQDIEDRTGLDKSTISRVCNVKYVRTKWGTFPMRYFFGEGITTDGGEELATRKVKLALSEAIRQEDKRHPLSDETLTRMLNEKGFPVARRTVAKYRERLGFPVARLRKS